MKLEGCNEKIQVRRGLTLSLIRSRYSAILRSGPSQVLKMEVYVLGELGVKGRHFCKIEDKGKYGTFNYVVMTLVGKSLQVREFRKLEKTDL